MSVVVCFYLQREHLDIMCDQMVTYAMHGLSIAHLFMGVFTCSKISDHLAIKQQCNHIHSPFIQPVISLLYVHTPFWFSTRGVSLPISCIAHGS